MCTLFGFGNKITYLLTYHCRARVPKTSKRGGVGPNSIESQSFIQKSVYGGGTSRTILSSSSRRNMAGGSEKMLGTIRPPVQVQRSNLMNEPFHFQPNF